MARYLGCEMAKDMPKYGPYRKVYTRMSSDEKYCRLTRPQPCGMSLWHEMLFGEQTDIVPGLFKISEEAFAAQLHWSLKGFRKAFDELLQEGMVKADWQARLVWVPNALKYNLPFNPNVVKSWGVAWEKLPDCELKAEAFLRIRQEIEVMAEHLPKGEAFLEAFDLTCRKPFAKSLPKPFAKDSPKDLPKDSGTPSGNQETGDRNQESGDRKQKKEDVFFAEEKKMPSPQNEESNEHDDEPVASLQADARECSVAWRQTILGRKPDAMDGLEVCDETFADMLARRVPKEIILAKIGTKKKRRYLNKFCDELESELGLRTGDLYTRPMLPETREEESTAASPETSASDFEKGWAAFERDFKKYVPGCPKNTDFLERVKLLFGPPGLMGAKGINATPDEMMFALNCYLQDPRRTGGKPWGGRFASEAYLHLPGYILKKREREPMEEKEKAHASQASKQRADEPQGVREPVAFATDPECAKIADALREKINEARFKLWFTDKARLLRGDDGFEIRVPNLFLKDWLKTTFGNDVKAAIKEALGADVAVKYVIDATLFQAEKAKRHPRGNDAGERQEKVG